MEMLESKRAWPKSLAILSACCCGLVCPGAAWAGMHFEYSWAHVVDGNRVRESGLVVDHGSDDLLSRTETDTFPVAPPFPGDANSHVMAYGLIVPETRTFGVAARAEAWVTPYDPDLIVPHMPNPEVSARIRFEDTVFVLSPSLAPNARIDLEIQPALFSGEMRIPAIQETVGNTSFSLVFEVEEVTLGSTPVPYTFEMTLPNGDATSWTGSLGGFWPRITVRNLRQVHLSLDMYAAAGVIGSPLPTQNPPRSVALSDFGSTLRWGGIAGFYDEFGNPLTDVQLTSDSGFDWVTPVPEPAHWLLMMTGVLVLGWRRWAHLRAAG